MGIYTGKNFLINTISSYNVSAGANVEVKKIFFYPTIWDDVEKKEKGHKI